MQCFALHYRYLHRYLYWNIFFLLEFKTLFQYLNISRSCRRVFKLAPAKKVNSDQPRLHSTDKCTYFYLSFNCLDGEKAKLLVHFKDIIQHPKPGQKVPGKVALEAAMAEQNIVGTDYRKVKEFVRQKILTTKSHRMRAAALLAQKKNKTM